MVKEKYHHFIWSNKCHQQSLNTVYYICLLIEVININVFFV